MGAAEKLAFKLKWVPSDGQRERLTTAELVVMVDDRAIWPVQDREASCLEMQADDLLAYLAEFWKSLLLRQTYPIQVMPKGPSGLRYEAEKRWASQELPNFIVEREDERVSAFEEAHDLSRCFAGLFDLPPLWLFRAADGLTVETDKLRYRLPFKTACEALAAVGDEIARRFSDSGDERWSDLIEAWRGRNSSGSRVDLLALVAGLSRDTTEMFVRQGKLTLPLDVEDAAADDDELRIAARMAGALPSEQVLQVLDQVRKFPECASEQLDLLSKKAGGHIRDNFGDHRPFLQGQAAALFVRNEMGLGRKRVDIVAIIKGLGVELREEEVQPSMRDFDALAVWGRHHGPAVFLNRGSVRVRKGLDLSEDWAARVTLAHELCHLLLDRGHAVSAVDVLYNRMPLEFESRARAFAAEILLPGHVAAEDWRTAGEPKTKTEMSAFLERMNREYGVTKSVASWKIEHGLHQLGVDSLLGVDVRALLDAIVPYRHGDSSPAE